MMCPTARVGRRRTEVPQGEGFPTLSPLLLCQQPMVAVTTLNEILCVVIMPTLRQNWRAEQKGERLKSS